MLGGPRGEARAGQGRLMTLYVDWPFSVGGGERPLIGTWLCMGARSRPRYASTYMV